MFLDWIKSSMCGIIFKSASSINLFMFSLLFMSSLYWMHWIHLRVSLSPIIPLTVKHLLFSEAFLIKKIVILTVDFLCFYWRPKISLFKWECINCIQYWKPKYHLLQPVFDLHWTLLTLRYSYRKSYQDDEIVFVYTLPCRALWNDQALLYLTMSQY